MLSETMSVMKILVTKAISLVWPILQFNGLLTLRQYDLYINEEGMHELVFQSRMSNATDSAKTFRNVIFMIIYIPIPIKRDIVLYIKSS